MTQLICSQHVSLPIIVGLGLIDRISSTKASIAIEVYSTIPFSIDNSMTMTEQPSSSSSSTNADQVLQQALTAYLQPLLKKHNSNSLPSNSDQEGEELTYEDLNASWKAADAILKQHAFTASTVVVVRN
jgi:hypothetical protein